MLTAPRAQPSEGALGALLRRVASRAGKDDSSGGATATMDVDPSGSALVAAADPLALSQLLDSCSFVLPANSKSLTKNDVKKGAVLYDSRDQTLRRVHKISRGWVHTTDSAGGSAKVRPGKLRIAFLDNVARFPPEDGTLTEEPLLATPQPEVPLPPADTIIKVVDGMRSILSAREIRLGSGFSDTERLRLQSSVETKSDALDLLELVALTLDGVLSSVHGDRARTIHQASLEKVNREVKPLVLLASLQHLLRLSDAGRGREF